MSRRFPLLNQLRAFEAAARRLSFRDAADELNVTDAAISHQIKTLEENLGARLFTRGPRVVSLTDAAQQLSEELTTALDAIDHAVSEFQSEVGTQKITINSFPTYANKFLFPALDTFHEANPGLKIRVSASYDLISFPNPVFDAALRHGRGQWPGLAAVRINDDMLSPVCARDLLGDLEPPLSPEQIASLPLAFPKGYEDAWTDWFELVGFTPTQKPDLLEFDTRALANDYALAGHGISLSDVNIVSDHIQSGRLIRLHPSTLKPDSGVYLVYPDNQRPEKFDTVVDWLRSLFPDGQNTGGR